VLDCSFNLDITTQLRYLFGCAPFTTFTVVTVTFILPGYGGAYRFTVLYITGYLVILVIPGYLRWFTFTPAVAVGSWIHVVAVPHACHGRPPRHSMDVVTVPRRPAWFVLYIYRCCQLVYLRYALPQPSPRLTYFVVGSPQLAFATTVYTFW